MGVGEFVERSECSIGRSTDGARSDGDADGAVQTGDGQSAGRGGTQRRSFGHCEETGDRRGHLRLYGIVTDIGRRSGQWTVDSSKV